MSKKCTLLWREAHVEVKGVKNWRVRRTFGRSDVVSRGGRAGLCTLSKVCRTWGFCSRFQKRWQTWDIWRGSAKMHFPWQAQCKRHDVRRSGRWFPERGCILEHQIFSFGKMILRDRHSTSSDLASLFRGRHSTLDRWSGKNAKRIGTRSSALRSTFHFWTKSRRIVSLLMLSIWKIEEVSQKCFVCDVVNFEKWGRLAELLHFWCCQVQKLRKSRRIASFWMLASSKIEEVSQNCCVYKLTVRQLDRQTDRQADRQTNR